VDAATEIDLDEWKVELEGQQEFFDKIGDKMPKALRLQRELFLSRIETLKKREWKRST
jgi:GTP-dependent phosphoenolpyruvate carboxykinase